MSDKKLSPTMLQAIEHMKANNGKLFRYPGGYWAPANWLWFEPSFGTSTIEALVQRGIAHYTEWKKHSKSDGQFPIQVELLQEGEL